jgi:hypothetical protein
MKAAAQKTHDYSSSLNSAVNHFKENLRCLPRDDISLASLSRAPQSQQGRGFLS